MCFFKSIRSTDGAEITLCKLHAVVSRDVAMVIDCIPYRASMMLRYGSLSELAEKEGNILLERT
jgi:hypothetical protein